MNEQITAGTGAVMTILVGLTIIARSWPTRPHGQHRASARTVPSEGPLDPPSPCTTPAFTNIPDHAVVAQRFDNCPVCGRATAGVAHRNSWTCGECLTSKATPAQGGAR